VAGWTELKNTGEASGFRVVLTVLKSNARLHEHKAAGGISVQAIVGHIRMHVQDKVIDLPAGHMLALDARFRTMWKLWKIALSC